MPVKSNEFDVVVMAAGKGSRLSELTERKPKCLLPIGNISLVYFPLKLIENFGFSEVYLVVLEVDKIVIESALEKTDLRLKINIVTIPDKDWGTADTLRYMQSYFTHDIIVISSDLVTNVDLKKVLEFHRKLDCSFTAVYFPFKKDSDVILPGRSSKITLEKDILAIIPETNELVLAASLSEFNETVNISKDLIKKYKNIQLRSDLQDAHLYLMKKGTINFLSLESNKDISTLKGDVLPFLVRKQSSNRNRYTELENDVKTEDLDQPIDVDQRLTEINMLVELCKEPEYAVQASLLSSYNGNRDDLRIPNSVRPIKCCAYITDEETNMIRINTMYGYCKTNKMISKMLKQFPAIKFTSNIASGAEIESSKVEKSSCFVGTDTKILTNVILKATTVGSRCLLKPNSRINGCIIMDDVNIGENCTLNNCIICDNVTINSGSDLKNCIIGSNHVIAENSSFVKDVLSSSEKFMEI